MDSLLTTPWAVQATRRPRLEGRPGSNASGPLHSCFRIFIPASGFLKYPPSLLNGFSINYPVGSDKTIFRRSRRAQPGKRYCTRFSLRRKLRLERPLGLFCFSLECGVCPRDFFLISGVDSGVWRSGFNLWSGLRSLAVGLKIYGV